MMTKVRDYFTAHYGEQPRSSSAGRKFHRLCDIIHDLDKHKPELDEIKELFLRFRMRQDNTKAQDLFAEYALISGHLSWLGALQSDEDLSSEFQSFSSSSEHEGLIKRANQELRDDASLSFLLPNHERNVSNRNKGSTDYRRDLFETLPREHFFPKILSVINAVWPKCNLGLSPRTLDAHVMMRNKFIQFMHKQLLQNALTHAYADVTFNKNYGPASRSHFSHEGDDFLFGVLAYLEIMILDPDSFSAQEFRNELASFHPNLGERGQAIHEKLLQRSARLCSFSYCDSGPGIERHIRNFSPQKDALPDDFDARYVLDNKLSGRSAISSGEGLSDVRTLAKEASAVLVIETPNANYINDTNSGVELSIENKRLARGTSVTILFEV